jgi:DNA-binding NtrC family response regulator
MSFESTLFPPEHVERANALQSETAGTVDLLLGEGFSLPTLLENVARYYLERAIEQANGNKTEAARLVGLPSYQTFTNWVTRYKAQPANRRTGSRPLSL